MNTVTLKNENLEAFLLNEKAKMFVVRNIV